MKGGVSFWKGRVALYAILKAMGIGRGDEVILPGFTCVVVPNAVLFTGATPVFCDVPEGCVNITPGDAERLITPRTRAVIIQHTFGIPCDVHGFGRLTDRRGLRLIEDCAHALGGAVDGRQLGTFGDAAFFSAQWSKPLTAGLGGIAVSDDAEILEGVRRIQRESVNPRPRESAVLRLQLALYDMFYRPSLAAWGLRIHRLLSRWGLFVGSSDREELESRFPTDFQKRWAPPLARIAMRKLADLDADVRRRLDLAAFYGKACGRLGLKVPDDPSFSGSVLLRYPVLVENKEEVIRRAAQRGVEIGDWFLSPVHPNKDRWENAGYRRGMCPAAERLCARIVNLPMHHRMDRRSANKLVEWLARHARRTADG